MHQDLAPSLQGPETFEAVERDSVVSRIRAHALRAPSEIALADGRHGISFERLDRWSDEVARHLDSLGVKPDDCVGLFFDRSIDFVVAALGALKSGAAYLPMDSATPAERAAMMLADADAPVVLSHRNKTSGWQQGSWRVLELEQLGSPPVDASLPLSFAPESLAYVVYTSGSTGRPKGVEITHANLLNLIDWHQVAFDVTPADRASQVAGLGFDATVWELWPHLAAGVCVHIADEATRRSPQALRDWLVSSGITIAFVPTVLAEQLVQSDWPAETLLRTLLTGADVLHRHPVSGLPFTVVNNYGPSECTVVATSGTIAPTADHDGRPSIGRAIRGMDVWLLDDKLQPVPHGEPGEICLAGESVGRGYRNRPELSAERFTTIAPDSLGPVRIYRTGDRARLLPSGELAFLGRLDDQIKIRGYRIEPGEIVATLDRISGIEASAVAAIDGNGERMLVAYVVVADGSSLTGTDLREYLARQLPDYMIPGHFVRLAELPLSANGKLNKAALPAPEPGNLLACRVAAEAETGQPDDLQEQVSRLVAKLLGRESVGAGDNFFLLGGHSMLAAQLVAQVADRFGVKVSLRQLFSSPTAASLSAEIRRLRG